MITYPSTHGVFEASVREICRVVHAHGGQVYMDGANMNAQVGLTSPAANRRRRLPPEPAQDVLHPARRRRPGHGPDRASPSTSRRSCRATRSNRRAAPVVRRRPWGSAEHPADLVDVHRDDGRRRASPRRRRSRSSTPTTWPTRLRGHYRRALHRPGRPRRARVHHRLPAVRRSAGVEVEDIAKRLMDYGFHAPTMCFPVPGTLMIEPTESEPRAELDRFCDAMIAIREEIRADRERRARRAGQPAQATRRTPRSPSRPTDWTTAYSREQAAFPAPWLARAQVLAAGRPHRQRLRRPQPRLHLPADRVDRRIGAASGNPRQMRPAGAIARVIYASDLLKFFDSTPKWVKRAPPPIRHSAGGGPGEAGSVGG